MLFIIIGSSRIGIGRIGLRGQGGTNDISTLSNASVLGRYYLSLLSNAHVVSTYDLYLWSNADILDGNLRQVLSNATIIGMIELPLLSNASIANLLSVNVLSNAYVTITQLLSTLSNASVLGPLSIPLLSNASISGPRDLSFLSNASIAQLIALASASNANISIYQYPAVESNANIAIQRQHFVLSNALIIDIRYWALGPEGSLLDLSRRVYDPEPHGFGLRTSQQRMPEGRRVNLLDEGLEGGDWTFTILFQNDSDRQIFQNLINNDSEDFILHHGRSDRYHRVKRISVEPAEDELWRGRAALKITCLMEDPYLYYSIDQGLDLGANSLPTTDTSKYNYGSANAPFLFRVGGFYSGGLQLVSPYVVLMNGAAEERSLYLGPGLLSAEYAELTLDGWHKYYLTHAYADDYATNNYWQYDRVHSGCSLASGQVSVPSGAWFYYVFQGYPLKKNIKLLATITKSGSPLIQYSTDGSTWNTAISASEISSGIQKEYWLTGTEKQTTVYVRFYSPTGSSMTVQDVSFEMLRDISAQYDQIPSILPGETRALKFTGSGSAKAKIKTTFRARWQPA